MTAEAFALLVAVAVPIITLVSVVGLILGITALERSRNELIELRAPRT